MLILSRKQNESILIDGDIRIMVTSIEGGQVRLGIQAPRSVGIYREEILVDAANRKPAVPQATGAR